MVNIAAERGKVTAERNRDGGASAAAEAMPRELRLPVAVQAERRPPASRWSAGSTVPVGVTPGAAGLEPGAVLVAQCEGRPALVHLGDGAIVLHRRETEGVLANLQSPAPALYVVTRPDDGPLGARLHLVTASDHEAQDHTDAGEDAVERVPIPTEIGRRIAAFVAAHHAEEPHHKRKRRPDRPEERKFGREPLWSLPEGARPRDAVPGADPAGADGPERGGPGRSGSERGSGR